MNSISIITPSLDQGQYISRTIESVLSQDLQPMEHLVVDGGSSDQTHEVLKRYESQVRVICEPDRGQADAVNKGLSNTSGEIIGWLNSDDMYCPGALRQVHQFFEQHPQADVVYGHANYIDEEDDCIKTFRAKPFSRSRMRQKNLLCQPAVFFRRRVLAKCGMLNIQLKYWMDYEFWLRLIQCGTRFKRLTTTLAAFRVHPGNKTLGNPSHENRLEAAEEIIEVLQKQFQRVPSRWILNYGHAVAQSRELDREQPDYDRTVLLACCQAIRCSTSQDRLPWPEVAALVLRHVGKECENLVRCPHNLVRFLPEPAGRMVQTNLRRKIFRLRHHKPRAVKTPSSYDISAPSSSSPLVSIVTPSLNQGAFLEQTICSVLQQDYPNLQYIVQDGGSTDESLSIIQRYQDHLACWVSGPDRGQAHAINLGMEQTTGDILAYLNSDDLLLPGAVSYVARYFAENPDVDVVYGHRILIDEDGQEIGRWVLPRHDNDVLPWIDYIPQETMFWRRSAWQKVGGQLDESFKFAMDWDLILRFREAGLTFARLPRFLGAFRVSRDQKTCRLIETTGRLEMKHLRQRTIGHTPTNREIRRVVRNYMWRHWLLDYMYRLGLLNY